MTAVTGLSHIMLTVTELEPARGFWAGVLGFEVAVDGDAVVIFVHPGSRLGVGCMRHPHGHPEPFDERRVGLDHIALQVADVAALRRFEDRFQQHDVPFTPIVESDWGWHLNARGPENLAVELHATKPEVLDALYGRPVHARERLAQLIR